MITRSHWNSKNLFYEILLVSISYHTTIQNFCRDRNGFHGQIPLQWRPNERDGVSNHRRLHCLFNCWFGADQRRKHQSSASLAFVRWIHRWRVNSPHKRPATRKMLPFDDVIIPLHKISKGLGYSHFAPFHMPKVATKLEHFRLSDLIFQLEPSNLGPRQRTLLDIKSLY